MTQSKIIKQNTIHEKMLQPFENKWVALTRDHKKVIASGDTLRDVYASLEKKEVKSEPIFMKVFALSMDYAPAEYAL